MLVRRIDAVLTAEKMTALNAAYTTIEAELDFLVSLEPGDARKMAKMGLRNETFTRATLEAAALNPTIVPLAVDQPALERDEALREQLLALQQRTQRLHDRLYHSNAVLGAQMYSGALGIYKALKVFGRAAGLGMLLDELGRRFKRTPKTPVVDPAPPVTP
jgi:hypothetical protein